MTGFLAALVARATGEPPALRPRAAHLFEPRVAPVAPLPRPIGESATRDLGPADRESMRRGEGELSPRGSRPPDDAVGPGTTPPAGVPPEAPARAGVERELRRAASAGALRARAHLADSPPVSEASPPAVTDTSPARASRAGPGQPRRASPTAIPERDALSPDAPAGSRTTVSPDESPRATSGPAQRSAAAPDEAATGRPGPARPATPHDELRRWWDPLREHTPTRPGVDVAAILRDEVYRALVAQGAVPARERPVVPGPDRAPTRPPRRGTAVLRADGVTTAPARGTPAGASPGPVPSVHVHIDRVSVTRAPAAAAAPPAPPPGRPLVNHAAYLVRRRERG